MSRIKMPRVNRRIILTGLGGVTLGLPFLESLRPRGASLAQAAGEVPDDTFAVFFRQGCGVGSAQQTLETGSEPEQFWPREEGPLTDATLAGRALDELSAYKEKILAVGNVNMAYYPYDDGHANGILQCLTAQGPQVPGLVDASHANGESLDNRIARELNPAGTESLVLFTGNPEGWIGGPTMSYAGPGNRRSGLNPLQAYQLIIGGEHNSSVVDLLRDQLKAISSDRRLSEADLRRLEHHQDAIRSLENALTCAEDTRVAMMVEGLGDPNTEETDGEVLWKATEAHMQVAAFAVACGYTRSVAIQMGSGNAGEVELTHSETGERLPNIHFISHRRNDHGTDGEVLPEAVALQQEVDRQYARKFGYLIDALSAYDSDGDKLLERGVAIWHNDLGNGPAHSPKNVPFIIAGNCHGAFKQGKYLRLSDVDGETDVNHASFMNALGTGIGLRTPGEDDCRDFGSEDQVRTPHSGILA